MDFVDEIRPFSCRQDGRGRVQDCLLRKTTCFSLVAPQRYSNCPHIKPCELRGVPIEGGQSGVALVGKCTHNS